MYNTCLSHPQLPTASLETLAHKALSDTPGGSLGCACVRGEGGSWLLTPSIREWCVGGAMNGQRGVYSHRHHSSSEMRSVIYPTARLLYWEEKREGKRWVYELTPGISFVSFAMIAGLVQSVDVGAFFSPLSITRIIHPPLPSVTQCFTVLDEKYYASFISSFMEKHIFIQTVLVLCLVSVLLFTAFSLS